MDPSLMLTLKQHFYYFAIELPDLAGIKLLLYAR